MSTVAATQAPVKSATKKPATVAPDGLVPGSMLKLPRREREAAYLASLPNDEARARWLRRVKRSDVYARTPFNKRVLRLIALLVKVRDELDELAATDEHNEILTAWAKAGVPFDGERHSRLDEASYARQDAIGCLWAVRHYLSTLENAAVERTRRSRR